MRKAKSNMRPKQLTSLEVDKARTGPRRLYADMSEAQLARTIKVE